MQEANDRIAAGIKRTLAAQGVWGDAAAEPGEVVKDGAFPSVRIRECACNQGVELQDKGRELRKHFEEVGTPIMMGGGELAFTCIGIDYNESLGEIKFLILDPHYAGKDEVKAVQARSGPRSLGTGKAGGVQWQGIEFFDQDAFYNLCCPQRVNMI